MATPFRLPFDAVQVGMYFVRQYYQMLEEMPDFVSQFYNECSTMIRIDGNTRETAGGLMQIFLLIWSLHYTEIEIRSANSLESWNGGVLVMVSGSAHVRAFNRKRKFVQTFFLAPQEKGYFVLNDIFHYIDDLQHPSNHLSQSSSDCKLTVSATIQEQVLDSNVIPASNYILGEEAHERKFMASANKKENGSVKNYSYAEEQLLKVTETEKIHEDISVQSNGSLQSVMNSIADSFSNAIEEPVMEPERQTYASIVAKGQLSKVPSNSSSNKPIPSERQHIPESLRPRQLSVAASNAIDSSRMEAMEEASFVEDEAEIKSVYVKNVPSTMTASEIANEFRKFGDLSSEGVTIRTRKDIGVCYAFVEFEDISGVQNAIQAHFVPIGGHQLYVEGRRTNRSNPIRGGRGKGRGRVSHQMEGTRGYLGGQGFGSDRNLKRSGGNGFHKQAP